METFTASFHGSDPDTFNPDHKGDQGGQYVEFYFHPVAQKDYCKILFPGDRQKVWNQPVRIGIDDVRYHAQYQAYKAGKSQLGGQTLLKSWGQIDDGSVDIYNSVHIKTVESLAALSDQNMSNLPPGHQSLAIRHRTMAREYVDSKKQAEGFEQAVSAAEQAEGIAQAALSENQELKAQLEELQRRMDAAGQEPAPEEPEPAENPWPKLHKRKPGGWEYELSDGQIVVGKEAAEESQRVLDSIG